MAWLIGYGPGKRLNKSHPGACLTSKSPILVFPNVFRKIIDFTKELFSEYLRDDAFNLGAALAYYTVFSFAPLLVVATSVASYFIGAEAANGRLYRELESLLGPEAASTLEEIVKNAYLSGDSTWAAVIGVGTLVFAATGVFNNLQLSLNKIWQIKSKPSNGVLSFIMTRLLSFSFVVGLGFLLMITLVINALIIGFMDQVADLLPGTEPFILAGTSWLLTTFITALIFALLFRFLPDARARWRDIWAGAIFTALLFGLGRFLIGYYIGNSDFSSTYGAAAALITLLVWTYFNSQILFLGAEFTATWARWRGNPIVPTKNAVKIRTEEIQINQNAE